MDLLIVRPPNALSFMKEWLEKRREYYQDQEDKPMDLTLPQNKNSSFKSKNKISK